jgi:hypothetical protein
MVSRDLSVADLELFNIQRYQLMVGLYVVGVVNGLTAGVYQAFHRQSLAEAALNLFDVNVVVLLAAAIGISLAWRSCDRVTRGTDLVAAVLFAAMIIVPDGRVSWIALSLLALYNMMFGRRCTYTVAAASVLAALSFHEAWARMIKNIFTVPLTHFDAALVGMALDLTQQEVSRNGNLITTGNDFTLMILQGCASFGNASLALLCWVAITRSIRPRWKPSEWFTVLTIIVCVVGLNVMRMVLMAMGGPIYEAVHRTSGGTFFNLLILAVSMLISLIGVRHEIWANCSGSHSRPASSWKCCDQDQSA